MLKLADLRKTTRKSGEEGLRTVYPRFLRDRALNPRIELAIRYLEKMLGHARRPAYTAYTSFTSSVAPLRAHHEARLVAMNASAKIAAIDDLLCKHAGEKVIVFSEYVDMVDRISRALMLPAITYRTPAAERRAILEGFRSGAFSKLVTGRVLNEGVDVPDATVAIVASGSSSMREYVQRLGRVLRPKPTEATLYELISRRTTERNASRRRRPKKSPVKGASSGGGE